MIALVKDVQEKLKVKIGDVIVYLEEPDGEIVLKVISYDQLLKPRENKPFIVSFALANKKLAKKGVPRFFPV